MSQDRQLIDQIKWQFARKSSAQLEAIAQAKNHERWSAEAITAAGEVLQDRLAGRAREPAAAEEEPAPPPYHYEPWELALGVLGGLLTPYVFLPYYRTVIQKDPDLPAPFGPKMAWLALDATDTEAVATALDLMEGREATWGEGIEAAHQASVFVTPPLGEWTLAASTVLFPPDRVAAFVKPLLEHLSRQFGDAQYFCTLQDIELQIWARAWKGRLVRGYGWLGARGITLWDEGEPTKEERDLGLQFLEARSLAVQHAPIAKASPPDEAAVMQLACLWSIDPTALDGQFKEPGKGLLGNVGWAASRSGR
jgi:hypothetical protein